MCLDLGIGEFIGRGIQTVSKFESVVKHIQKYEQEIESILKSIVTAKLLKFPLKPDKSDELPGKTTVHAQIIGWIKFII